MTIENLKLYHYPASRSARVKWLLHELVGDDFEVEIVSLYDGEQFAPDYLRLNPNHSVPMLEITTTDGEFLVMIESGAMISFLADAYPEMKLAPPADSGSLARADYLQMLHFGASWMDMMLWQIRVHEHLLPDDERDPRTIARYRKKFTDEAEPQLITRLEKSAFVCGDEFCAVDCIIAHSVAWANRYGLCTHSAFRGYLSHVSKRPAFAMAFADAGQFSLELPEDARQSGRFTG